jgi:hypothetical protein
MQPDPAPAASPTFPGHLRDVQRKVREALSALFGAVGSDPRQPQELARRFGLNTTTAWKLCKVIREESSQAFVEHMPGTSGANSLFRSMRKQGAPESAILPAQAAVEEFRQMIQLHAGDRATLERMSAGPASQATRRQREAHRKLSYRGNSCTWGVQAELQLMASFLAPSATPGMTDLAKVVGLMGFCRLRPDAIWPMTTTGTWNDYPDGDPLAEMPLDLDYAREHGMPLLPEFSTDPPPALNMREVGTLQVIELSEGPVGMTGSVSCLFGVQKREFGPIHRSEQNTQNSYFTLLSTPAEAVIADLFIHRDLGVAGTVEAFLRSQLNTRVAGVHDGKFRGEPLPLDEPLASLGSPPAVMTPEFPRYGQLMDWVCERMGWNFEEFEGVRVRMAYPPIPTVLEFRHGMLDPPAG